MSKYTLNSVLCLCSLFGVYEIKAQDIHYTQWFNAPYQYNPSYTGDFDGDYRFIGNHRNQWSSVSVPFVTLGGMADAKGLLPVKKMDVMGGFLYDVTGDSRFTSLSFKLGAAYALPFLPDSILEWKVGGQFSMNQRRLSMARLNFDDQFDGFLFNGGQQSFESLARFSRWYSDVALGTHVKFQLQQKIIVRLGISVFNLANPKQSFFENELVDLAVRWNYFGELLFPIQNNWEMAPGFLYTHQFTYRSINFGSKWLLNLSENEFLIQKLILGAYLRSKDAAALLLGYQYDQWWLTMSYDINFSDLVPASNYRGGIEFALIHILKRPIPKPKFQSCPIYY